MFAYVLTSLLVVNISLFLVRATIPNIFDSSLPTPSASIKVHQRVVSIEEKNIYNSKRKLFSSLQPEITPLYPGYGTHYAYIYVGTPPQRQTVIIDTGSHYIAFPCKGCQDCGTHTGI